MITGVISLRGNCLQEGRALVNGQSSLRTSLSTGLLFSLFKCNVCNKDPPGLLLFYMHRAAQTLSKHGTDVSHSLDRETSFLKNLGYYTDRKPTKQVGIEEEREMKGREM